MTWVTARWSCWWWSADTDLSEADVRNRIVPRSLPPGEASQTFDEVESTFSPEEAIAEARRVLAAGFDLRIARMACPFKVDLDGFIRRIADGDPDGALEIIRRSHPFASVFGRMCHRWCELQTPPLDEPGVMSLARYPEFDRRPDAPRPRIDRPAFPDLERFAGDYGDPARTPVLPQKPPSGKRVAVVGGGSAGLGGAWMLRRLGHEVDIYDMLHVPGGTLFSGYPPFRMAKFGVRRDNDPAAWGARFFGGVHVTREMFERIVNDYDFTLATIGIHHPYMVGIDGEDADGVWNALDFIAAVSMGTAPANVRRALIIGAGGTARDACRTARRLGAEVTVCYRRSFELLELGRDPNILGIIGSEGVQFLCLVQPTRVLSNGDGRVTGVEFLRTELGPPEENPVAVPIDGTEFVVECDTVVEAIGEGAGLGMFPPSIALKNGHVVVDRADHRTSHPKVFAAGELIGDNGNDTAALGAMQAAFTMDSILRDEPLVLFDSRPFARLYTRRKTPPPSQFPWATPVR